MKALVWPVATYGCESWTLRKNEEIRLDAFEMKGLRKILRVSWTAKITIEWVLNKAGVRPRTAWMDNIKMWTGLSMEESVRMTEDRDKWRKYVHGVANPRIEDG